METKQFILATVNAGWPLANAPLATLQRKMQTAELLSKEIYKTQCRTLGESHRETLISLSNVGWLMEKQNKNWRAKLVYQKAYETMRAAFGENDPDTRDIWGRIVRMRGGR